MQTKLSVITEKPSERTEAELVEIERPHLSTFLSPVSFWSPEYVEESAWLEHAPFAFWLIEAHQPRSLVELGTHGGYSYFSFCQAVKDLVLDTRCYAVDHWKGDEHAGSYGEDVFQRVQEHNFRHYSAFSRLIRSSFADALPYFSDKSIDLLHIDGRHFYEDVQSDFESWRHKLSERAVILFHDTNVRERNFGVFKLWEELREEFPYFEFVHGHGLGILGYGAALPERVSALFRATRPPAVTAKVRAAYARLGASVKAEFDSRANIEELTAARALEKAVATDLASKLKARDEDARRLEARLNAGEVEATKLDARLKARDAEAAELDARLKARDTEATELDARLKARDAEAAELAARLKAVEAHTSALTSKLKLKSQTLEDYRGRLAAQKQAARRLRRSTSWRITAILRAASRSLPSVSWHLRRMLRLISLLATGQFSRAATALRLYFDRQRLDPARLVDKTKRNPTESRKTKRRRRREVVQATVGAPYTDDMSPTHDPGDYLPRVDDLPMPLVTPAKVDIIIPVYRGLRETQRCLESLLRDRNRAFNRIIVVDDCTPEKELADWLQDIAANGSIDLFRNPENLGFVKSVNRGIEEASVDADVLLLNSDTEVPRSWLQRLSAHAYKQQQVGTVTPFSNNATICSYPTFAGGPLPLGRSLAEMDTSCWTANAGRSVEIPTAIGFCMYIRRDCLNDVGLFDAEAFGRGYGEENDFCMRAADKGWLHVHACDVFVYHIGEVSFGTDSPERKRAWDILVDRHPTYPGIVAKYVQSDPSAPSRFALTIALLKSAPEAKILIISHSLGGGTDRHIRDLVRNVGALFLILRPSQDYVELEVAGGTFRLPFADIADLVALLKPFGLASIHVHHVIGFMFDVRELVRQLAVPFDFTVHDYYTICPQINLLTDGDTYCGEPDLAGCNACLAERPSFDARDILSWRKKHEWLLREADRVICPSEDVRARLAKHRRSDRAIVVPHELVADPDWPQKVPNPPAEGQPLRIAVLGVLARHKGAAILTDCVEASSGSQFQFIVIGHAEQAIPETVHQTGRYSEGDLLSLIDSIDPHVIWFPAPWPETWSYTLSAAILSGRPIVASRIGAFMERLRGRPWTWIVEPDAVTATFIRTFESVRAELSSAQWRGPRAPRLPASVDFYSEDYLSSNRRPLSCSLVDLRRTDRTVALVVPERGWSPCAYIRLLQPLTHPHSGRALDVVVTDAREVLTYRADMVITHRTAVRCLEDVDRLLDHCRDTGMRLVYDIDDDLLGIPANHSDFEHINPLFPAMLRLARCADAVSVSTENLRAKMAAHQTNVRVVPNALDERIWADLHPVPKLGRPSPLRILYMGTATHASDLALIEPAIRRIQEEFGSEVSFEIMGVTPEPVKWAERVTPPSSASRSYASFVNWIKAQNRWHIGVAPLEDTDFTASKSAIKVLDYAGLGLAVVASDVHAYRQMIVSGETGLLVNNDVDAWYQALRSLIRRPGLRFRLAAEARSKLLTSHMLYVQPQSWLELLGYGDWSDGLEESAEGRNTTLPAGILGQPEAYSVS